MFRMELDGSMILDKIIRRIGGFHIVICILKTIFSRLNPLLRNVIKWSDTLQKYCSICYMYLLFALILHLFLGFKLSYKVSVSSKFYKTAIVIELFDFIAIHLCFYMHMVHFFLCIVQWLVYSDIEGEGTITNTLSGGDLKQAIYTLQKMKFSVKDFFSKCDHIRSCGFGHIYWRNPSRKPWFFAQWYLHKFIFEAIIRTKVKHFNYCSNFLTVEGRKLLEDFQKCVNVENLSDLLQQLKSIQFTPGDMSCWIEIYLEMVNLLLNVIQCQQTGNWNDFCPSHSHFFAILLCSESAQLCR